MKKPAGTFVPAGFLFSLCRAVYLRQEKSAFARKADAVLQTE